MRLIKGVSSPGTASMSTSRAGLPVGVPFSKLKSILLLIFCVLLPGAGADQLLFEGLRLRKGRCRCDAMFFSNRLVSCPSFLTEALLIQPHHQSGRTKKGVPFWFRRCLKKCVRMNRRMRRGRTHSVAFEAPWDMPCTGFQYQDGACQFLVCEEHERSWESANDTGSGLINRCYQV